MLTRTAAQKKEQIVKRWCDPAEPLPRPLPEAGRGELLLPLPASGRGPGGGVALDGLGRVLLIPPHCPRFPRGTTAGFIWARGVWRGRGKAAGIGIVAPPAGE